MEHDEAARFARDWVAGWNAHDLDRILAHYADDVVFTSPVAARLLPHTNGVVRGKAALRQYWAEGLRRIDGLHFEVIGVYAALDGLVINYRNQAGDLVNEVLLLRDGLVVSGFGAYAPPSPASPALS
jgi:ketosteroid isomerase-like protein